MEGGSSRSKEKLPYSSLPPPPLPKSPSRPLPPPPPFHTVHKIPAGEGPYVRAKHLQLVEKDLDGSIVWFWKAINERDRVGSALKDMAVVMKQQDRTDEAVEAIKSFRHLCSPQAQESLDNLLIDLYKKCGRFEEQIALLKQKLRMIYDGRAFNGKPTKTARSHGRKFQVSIKQEIARLLGNLGWAYMQLANYMAAEAVYRKAQMVEPNANNGCNLAVCLVKQGHYDGARAVVDGVLGGAFSRDTDGKGLQRAAKLSAEIEHAIRVSEMSMRLGEEMLRTLDLVEDDDDDAEEEQRGGGEEEEEEEEEWRRAFKLKRLPVFEEMSGFRDQMAF